MMYVRFFFATLANLLVTLLAYIVSPILPLFAGSTGYLPKWLAWFQTQDASLDTGWRDAYFTQLNPAWYLRPFVYRGGLTQPTGFNLYWLRMRWLWRNPAYGFCVALGVAYDPAAWVIDLLQVSDGSITLLKAHTKDGRFFAYTTSSGWKLGYKLWWAMGADFKLLDAVPASKSTGNRLPLCFTPKV